MNVRPTSLLQLVQGGFIFFLLTLSACSHEEPLSAMGLLEWDRVELIAETNERIMEISAREGDMLEAGSIILQQDSRRVQAQLDESQASLEQARARLAELKR
jgi:HlyD family secretion protein